MAKERIAPMASFSKSTFWDGLEHEITDAKFVNDHQFGNSGSYEPGVGLEVFYKTNGEPNKYPEFYSTGNAEYFTASKNGKYMVAHGTSDEISERSNYARFVRSLLEGGFDESAIDPKDIGWLVGTRFIGKEEPNPTEKNPNGTRRLVERVTKMPGEKTGSGGGKTNAPSEDDATSALMDALIANDGEIKRADLMKALKPVVDDDSAYRAIIKIVLKDEFLNGSDDWTYENGVVKLA